jgi:hypothetical protein
MMSTQLRTFPKQARPTIWTKRRWRVFWTACLMSVAVVFAILATAFYAIGDLASRTFLAVALVAHLWSMLRVLDDA